jgi:hypothetical protein
MTTCIHEPSDSVATLCSELAAWKSRVVQPRLRLLRLLGEYGWVDELIQDEFSRSLSSIDRALANFDISTISHREVLCGHADLVATELSAQLSSAFHYLGTPRVNALNLGLWSRPSGDIPVYLVSFAQFDLQHINESLPFGIQPNEVLVLARQVAVGSVPKDTWSFAFGRIKEWLCRFQPQVRMLLTYVDPNAGFTGAAYRAVNWSQFGEELKGRYVFLDGRHTTNRELIRRFGTARYDELSAILSGRIERTTHPVQPLRLYAYMLDRKDRRRSPANFECSFGIGGKR